MESAAVRADVPTPVSREVVPFIAVGVFAVLVDFALFNLFLWWHWPVWAANGVALLVSMSVAFIGNYKWTFSHREIKSLGHAYGTFSLINLAAVVFIEVSVVAVAAVGDVGDVWLNIVKAFATAVATLGRFFAYKRWVFF